MSSAAQADELELTTEALLDLAKAAACRGELGAAAACERLQAQLDAESNPPSPLGSPPQSGKAPKPIIDDLAEDAATAAQLKRDGGVVRHVDGEWVVVVPVEPATDAVAVSAEPVKVKAKKAARPKH